MKNNTNDNYFTKASFTNYINKVIKNSSINFKKKKRKLEETEVEYDNQIIEDMSFPTISTYLFLMILKKIINMIN